MKHIIIGLTMLFAVSAHAIEWPSLYGGPALEIYGEDGWSGQWSEAWIASDVVGKYGISVAVGLSTSGDYTIGISADLKFLLGKAKLDYKWGEKLLVKPVYLPHYNFDTKVLTHNIVFAVMQL